MNGIMGFVQVVNSVEHGCVLSPVVEVLIVFLIFQGLYGRSWTKIANMIDTRTALQVKNYAKQYFRQKVRKKTSATRLPYFL